MINILKLAISKMSFRNKLLLFYISLALLIVCMVGFGLSYFLYKTITNNEKKHLNQLLQVVNDDVANQIEVFNKTALELVISTELKENLNQTDDISFGRAKNKIENILKEKSIGNNQIQNLTIIDVENHAYTTSIGLMIPKDFDIVSTRVYQEAEIGGGSLIWLTSNDIYDKYITTISQYQSRSNIHAAAIIKNFKTKEVLGILILTLQNNYFQNMTYSDKRIDDTDLYMVAKAKNVVYKLAGTKEDLDERILQKLDLSNENSSTLAVNDKIVSYRYNRAMGWYLISVTDNDIGRNSIHQIMLVLFSILITALGIAVIFSRVLSLQLTKGIDKLVIGMEQVEKGNFDFEVTNTRRDELGMLAESFNHMVKQINDLVISKYQQELLTKEAEFHALQSQINPHFLYNTLDMLRWQLISREQEDLSESILAIGNLLRYAISNNQWNVPLQAELHSVKDYLSILCSISGKDIKTSFHIEDAENILLPKLTLQPLVENAVKHGFYGRETDNVLTIQGYYKADDLYVLEIIDNGLGIEPEKLVDLKQSVEDKSVGIRNVEKRIKYLYGNNASLTLQSQYGDGTMVRLILPLEQERDRSEADNH